MGAIDRAKAAIERITSNTDGFGVPLAFKSKTEETAAVVGLATKRHLGTTTEGQTMNGTFMHCSVSEKFLTDLEYPVRDANGDCQMIGDFVTITDSTGVAYTYIIREAYPDETIGLIVCILGTQSDE